MILPALAAASLSVAPLLYRYRNLVPPWTLWAIPAALLLPWAPSPVPWLAAAAAGGTGLLGPLARLRRRVALRRDVHDLLAALVEAADPGVHPVNALRLASASVRGPLRPALDSSLTLHRQGMSLHRALSALRAHPIPALRHLVRLVESATATGLDIGQAAQHALDVMRTWQAAWEEETTSTQAFSVVNVGLAVLQASLLLRDAAWLRGHPAPWLAAWEPLALGLVVASTLLAASLPWLTRGGEPALW